MEFDESVLEEAIQKWGPVAQLNMVTEECAELIVAIQKLKRNGENDITVANVRDELADVYLMVNQGIHMFGKNQVQQRIDFKVNRLKQRLNN